MSLSSARKNIVLTAVALLVTLGVGELAARLVLPPPYRIRTRKPSRGKGMPRFVADPNLGWVNAPDDASYHFVSSGPRGTTDAVYNMHGGFRDSAASPQAGPVLIAAGCSFTYGMGINDQDTWPWMVQEKMPGYHVINAGTSAYGVGQALMRADSVIERNPGQVKAVLFAFASFQVERDRAVQQDLMSVYPLGRPRFLESGDGIKNGGIVRFWTPGPLVERSALAMSVINHVAEIGNKTPTEEGSHEVSARIIEDFARRCQARHIAFGVIVLPHGSDTSPVYVNVRNFIVARLQKSHIPTFVPDFPRDSDGKLDRAKYLIPSDEFHPNRAYNLIFSPSAQQGMESLLGDHGGNSQ